MSRHQLIMIHGMGEGCSETEYHELENRIIANLKKPDDFAFVHVEWQLVTFPAERRIFEKCLHNFLPLPVKLNLSQFVFHPNQSIKYFMTFFVGDIVAYAAEPANKNGIRKRVWEQISEVCRTDQYSILAHSLGSIIAFDYLYKLFEKKTLLFPGKKPVSKPGVLSDYQNNFRHLFTFGSPIGLFLLRQGGLWLNKNEPFSEVINPVDVGHSWLNFYDKQDLAAYPLEKLFALNEGNKNKSLKDIKVQTGNLVVNSHMNYWKNNRMAKEIADALNTNP